MRIKPIEQIRQALRHITRSQITMAVTALAIVAVFTTYVAQSEGLLSSNKDNEIVVYANQGRAANLQLRGDVLAKCTQSDTPLDGSDDCVTEIIFAVTLPEDGRPIDFGANQDANVKEALDKNDAPVRGVRISYTDDFQQVDDLAWKATQYGPGNGDSILDAEEMFRITVDAIGKNTELPDDDLRYNLGAGTGFTLRIDTSSEAALVLERTTPLRLDAVMNLY